MALDRRIIGMLYRNYYNEDGLIFWSLIISIPIITFNKKIDYCYLVAWQEQEINSIQEQ
jgi:hypothetical protein